VQAPLEPCVAVGVGDTGAPPPEVVLELAGVVWVTDVVVVAVAGLVLAPVEVVGAPVVVDWVVDEDVRCLWVVVDVDELSLDPPHAASPSASITTAAATTATRARSPVHGVRCMS
jgi:hypothetical protein